MAKAKQSQTEWYKKNREQIRERKRLHYKQNSEKMKAQVRANWRKKNGLPEATRPAPDFCECCGNLPTGKQALHLDHCHATGVFRGWLCSHCNLALGLLGDTLESIEKAAAYLLRSKQS